jgi:TetR/AcrR family transcriptional repressor of nem operon
VTHGAFYCHFANKEDLAIAALRHALRDNRTRWVGRPRAESWRDRLTRLGRRYLNPTHRDDVADSCALAALATDAARSGPAFKAAYQDEVVKSLRAICAASDNDTTVDPAHFDSAIAFLALCIGGISLARAVEDPALSDRILDACRQSAGSLAAPLPPTTTSTTAEPADESRP